MANHPSENTSLRRAEPLLHHGRWFGEPEPGKPSLSWRLPGGGAPSVQDWHDISAHALACLIDSGFDLPAEGSPRLQLLFNPEAQEVEFRLPDGGWTLALDSSGVLQRRQGTTLAKSTSLLRNSDAWNSGGGSQPRSISGSSATISGLPAKADLLWYGESPGPIGVVGNHCQMLCPACASQSTKR